MFSDASTIDDPGQRLLPLQQGLAELAHLWRPQPYKAVPAWCAQYPALSNALRALDEETLAQLMADGEAAARYVVGHLPVAEAESLAALRALSEVEMATPAAPAKADSPHWQWDVPGRKWAQISAFADALGAPQAPLLEWCAGKGHLGRLLAARWSQPVTSLERDGVLCERGRALAERSRVQQQFTVLDVLTPAATAQLAGRHPLALHACGELHRQLLREAVYSACVAIDIAPCCYHLGHKGDYQPLSAQMQLVLSRDDLRLAVTQTATAAPREQRRRDQEMAWKLGLDLLRREHSANADYLPLRPINKAWLNMSYREFCHALAAREGWPLPADVDWSRSEAQGWQRQREVMRLGIVRAAFARVVEMCVVLDLSSYLSEQGYRVQLRQFCQTSLTPRNILISARKGH